MDSSGRNIKPGTSRKQSFPGDNGPKKIIGLASGFTYGLEVQVIKNWTILFNHEVKLLWKSPWNVTYLHSVIKLGNFAVSFRYLILSAV